MPSDEHTPYELQREGDEAAAGPEVPATGSEATPRPSRQPDPLPLEDAETPAAPKLPWQDPRFSTRALDVCPNCGATMRGRRSLVCVRCGFDLKSLTVLDTTVETADGTKPNNRKKKVNGGSRDTAEPEEASSAMAEPAGEAEQEEALPICLPGRGALWLPGTIAGVGCLMLLVAYLAGAAGLYPAMAEQGAEATITFADRLVALIQFLLRAAMWVGGGIAAIRVLAWLREAPMGDIRLALVRMAAIVVAMRATTILDMDAAPLEWTVEALLQLGVFIGLAMYLFTFKPRDAVLTVAVAAAGFILLWLLAEMVVWVGVV